MYPRLAMWRPSGARRASRPADRASSRSAITRRAWQPSIRAWRRGVHPARAARPDQPTEGAPASAEPAELAAEAQSRQFPLIALAVAVGSVGCGGGGFLSTKSGGHFFGMGKRKTIAKKGMLGKPESNDIEQPPPKRRRAKQESSKASPMKLIKLYPHMSGEQKRLIEGASFRGLVDLKCSKLRPDLCSWLMEHFNPATNQVVFPGRGAIDVNEESVKSMLGIPMGDKDVSYEMESEATEFVLNLLGINDGISPSLTSLGIQLEKLKLADDKYLRMWIIYAISSVLAPTTATTVSPRCYPSVVDAGNIKNLNCASLSYLLCKKLLKLGRIPTQHILYLDSLLFKNLNVPVEGYRATVWTNELINQAILADTSADGFFGTLPEKDRIVIAVQNLCEGFSDLVTKFVRQISGLDFMDPRGSQPRQMRRNRKRLAQRPKKFQQDEDLAMMKILLLMKTKWKTLRKMNISMKMGILLMMRMKEDDDDEGKEDDEEDRSENDDNDGAETARSGEQADAATDVTGCKGDDTNEGIAAEAKALMIGGKSADDVIGKGKQLDEGIGFGDKEKHEEKQAPNAATQNVPESEKQPVEKVEKYHFLTTTIDSHEVPNFNLGFDSSQEVVQTPKGQEAAGTSRGKEFPGIITNENYGSFTTEDYEKVGREADEAIVNKSATKSPVAEVISKEAIADDCEVEEETPVPHEYNKRVVKPAKFKRSPFIGYENKKQFVVSRVINEVCDDICKNGGRTKSRRNSLKIIDTGEYYSYLGDLANSVKPMGSLDNNTCELTLIVLSVDIKDNLKRIFHARIGGYLLDSQLDRNELKKHFDQTRANRLDHKELELCNRNDKAGHYFVVCLNLKAERFEVYDLLRGEDDEELISASNLVVASIKTMWDRVYMRSSKKTIQNYPLIFIDGPKQDNIRDGKQLTAFETSDIPNIKKLLTHKMLSFQGNRVQWMQVLWGKQHDPTLKH
uniref:Ubiquitin-like protease family profile domain-containing protein n=1 Tax=Oryza punctata TaxID=4537 RepID=A0A0E0LBL8_ORYPU